MRTTWNLLRAELSAHAAALRAFAIVAAIITAANLAIGGATPAIAVCALTAAFLPGVFFAQDERAHLDAMYSILPVTRTQLVVGRYLLIAFIAAVVTLAGLGVARIDELVRGPQASPIPLSTAAVAGMVLAVVGGRFCRNLRIRAGPTLFPSLYTLCPRRSGVRGSMRSGVPSVLILRLRHAHGSGPPDRRQAIQSSA